MSPGLTNLANAGKRFPRVSGDEPDYVSGKMEGIKFSPRERG